MLTESISFDRAAIFYDATRGFPIGVEKSVARNIAQAGNLDGDSRVLEIGVGTGRISLPLSGHVNRIFGIDLSRDMMERLNFKRTIERIDLTEGDATVLPFADDTFDAVIVVHVFHLIPNWEDALNEIKRVLKPSGRLIHGRNERTGLGEIRARVFAEETDNTVGLKWDEIDSFLPDRGWKKVDSKEHNFTITISPSILLDQIKNRVWSSMWSLSDEDVDRLVDNMEDVLRSNFANPDDPEDFDGTFKIEAFELPSE